MHLTHLSDEALVALLERGEEDALAELYDRYGQVAYSLAYRMLRNETLAEDAVQEAFLTVWRNAARFVPERAKASTWLLTIVHRRAVDLVRREERRRTEPFAPGRRGCLRGGIRGRRSLPAAPEGTRPGGSPPSAGRAA